MEILKPVLKNLIIENKSSNDLFERNLLKEYLQVIILNFIYSDPSYSKLVFYGGSCLAQCFGLPRLSEDLDFVDEKKQIKISELANDLENYFKKNTDLKVAAIIQKFRIYLKFPILHELGLSKKNETDLLFLKVEIFSDFTFCKKYKAETHPLFRFNRSMLVKTFDLPTLMATKIRAVLNRKWEKKDKTGKTTIAVKGRDYFDLMWYLEKGIEPNMKCIEDIKNKKELGGKLLAIVSNVDEKSIRLDLESFINDQNFVKNISRNMKEILTRLINEKLT
jgi:predicted nucleotidyltransferase component of viral defense system